MIFKSIKELENHILTKSEVAVKLAQEKAAMIINHFLTQFYNEFSPEWYARTEQLLRSLVKSEVRQTSNGWVAEVYFDSGALDYSTRIIPAQLSHSDKISNENTYHRNPWTDENTAWVLETAMTGSLPHGGYVDGTAIWTESMRVLDKEAINILKEKLIQAGIPVK